MMASMFDQYPQRTISEALDRIDSCFGATGGWWHSQSQETYHRLFLLLEEKGLNPGEAMGLLEEAFYAAASEYGD